MDTQYVPGRLTRQPPRNLCAAPLPVLSAHPPLEVENPPANNDCLAFVGMLRYGLVPRGERTHPPLSIIRLRMAVSDQIRTITDGEDLAWITDQRGVINSYLQSQGCKHAGVSLEPRWYLSPYLAIWAVRSKANPELIGWWAISGDVPTDYTTATSELQSDADVLAAFSLRWSQSSEAMRRGEFTGIGKPESVNELAPLLQKRAEMLQKLSEQLRVEERER